MLFAVKRVYRLARLAGGAAMGLSLFATAFSCVVRGDDAPAVVTTAATTDAATAPGNKVRLEYKFQSGQFVYYTGSSRIQYVQQFEATEIEDPTAAQKKTVNVLKTFTTVQQNETGTHFRVVTADENGNALIEPVVDRTRMTARMPDKDPEVFDSDSTAPVQPAFRTIRSAIGRPVARFQVSNTGEILKATVVDADADPGMKAAAEKLNMRFPFLARLPKTPVQVGDKWREDYSTTVEVSRGLKQPVPVRRIYELTSVSNGVALIKFQTVILRAMDDPDLQKQVMQQTPSGTIEFDIELGLVRSHASNVNQTAINAFGERTLLQVIGEAMEKIAPAPHVESQP